MPTPKCTPLLLPFLLAMGLFPATGCEEQIVSQSPSLQAPTQLAIANGEVCLPRVENIERTFPTGPLVACEDGGQGFGLVTNFRGDKVSVIALGQRDPLVVNLESRQPGVTAIPVGRSPVDVMTTADGTAALVANQQDQSLTAIDLWTLRPLATAWPLAGTPHRVEALPDSADGEPRAALLTRSPNALEIIRAPRCTSPGAEVDRRDHLPEENCIWEPEVLTTLELPASPADFSVDQETETLFVVYRQLGVLSIFSLSEQAESPVECLDPAESAPCETQRIAFDEANPESTRGAIAVDHDPFGLFVYALDRASNQLLVVDRIERTLIDASRAAEPPLFPFSTAPGIPLINAPVALAAEVQREIVSEEAGQAHVLYRIGARVVSDTAQIYPVTIMESECRFPTTAPLLSRNEFLFNPQARAQSEEAACLFSPSFPLGTDPDLDSNDDLLQARLFSFDDVQIAVTPYFGLRDSNNLSGRLVGRGTCTQPEEFVEALRAAGADGTTLGCTSGLAPRPLALDADVNLTTYLDVPAVTLTQFARAFLDAETGESGITRQVYDQRLRNEAWRVTYEGTLPGIAANERGLVDQNDPSRFLATSADYCAAGVEVGDRLRILSPPSSRNGCDEFEGDESRRTFEITAVNGFDLFLALLDDDEADFVSSLPRRECFDQGLRYEIRAHDAWVVAGDQSGMLTPYRREGESCVPFAEENLDRLQGRVETGEIYRGPYFQFLLRPGDVEPVEGLSYTFQVERNFTTLAEQILVTGVRGGDTPVILPASIRFVPDLGAGRYLAVLDSGAEAAGLPGGRIFLRNLSFGADPRHFLR